MGIRARQRTSEWISGRPEKHKSERDDDEEATVCARYDRRRQRGARGRQNRERGYKIQNEGGAADEQREKKKKYNNNKKAPKGPASKSTQQRSSHGRQSGADAERLRAADDCWEP